LRIFFVTPEFIELKNLKLVAGGLANYLYKITDSLSKHGHQVHVLIIGSKRKDIKINEIFLHFVSRKNFLGIRKFRKSKNPDSLVAREFLEKFNLKNKIDIIQYTSYTATGQFPARGIPSCIRISSYAPLHWKAAGGELSQKFKKEFEQEKEMFQSSKFIFGPSTNTNEFIEKDLNLNVKIKTIETPFKLYDKKEDESVYEKFLKGRDYLLFFGTLWKLKGSAEIAEIIYDFLGSYKNMSFAFVGKQNKNADNTFPIDEIIKNAKEFADRVVYIPSPQHSTLYPIIRPAHAVVLPSRYDNFPNTCIEAMGLKKAVIATKDAGFEQIIDDGQSGFLAQNSNAKSLLETLHKVMKLSNEDLENIGQKAYLRILDLSPEKITQELLGYYNFVISNWGQNGK
jgi:glycosyltransferase involved in cell wall biosynthesis